MLMVLEGVQQAVSVNLQVDSCMQGLPMPLSAIQQRTSVKRCAFLSAHTTCMPHTGLAVCVNLHHCLQVNRYTPSPGAVTDAVSTKVSAVCLSMFCFVCFICSHTLLAYIAMKLCTPLT